MRRREFLAALAAAPAGLLALERAEARPAGGWALAFVTADLESRIVAVDVTTGAIVARIATPPGPRSIETVMPRTAVVACTEGGSVLLVDSFERRVRHVLDDFSEPRYTAAGASGDLAYVTDSMRGELVVIDVTKGRIARRVEVGAGARHLAIDPSGTRLWVSLGTKAPELAVLDLTDPRRPRLRRRIAPVDLAHDIGFSHDGAAVWVTSGVDGRVAIHDPRTGHVVQTLAAGSPPQHVASLPGAMYVTSGDDGTLSVHAPDSGRALRRGPVRVPIGSFNVSASSNGARVVSPSLSAGTLVIANRSGRVMHHVRVGRAAHDACVQVVP
jgi:DNA-binding beta-propeller fold protein YncE